MVMSPEPKAPSDSAAPTPIGPPPMTSDAPAASGRRHRCPALHRMPGAGKRLAERRSLRRKIVGQCQEVAIGDGDHLGEGPRPRRHGDDLPRGAEIRAAGEAVVAAHAGDERIDRHAFALVPALDDRAGRFVAEDQWGRSAGIVAEEGVHVRAADADGLDRDEHLVIAVAWPLRLAELERLRCGVDERLHRVLISPGSPHRRR